jgi:hypothetical protein
LIWRKASGRGASSKTRMDGKFRELIARTERNFIEGQRRVLATHALIARLDPESADAAIARQILRSHLATQAILESHLADLRRVLAAGAKASDASEPAAASSGQRPTGQESDELA